MLKIKQYFRKFLYHFRKSKIKAVHENDLIEILTSMGVSKGVQNGDFSCIYCGETITFSNIEVFFKKHGEVKFVCSKLTCISNL